LSNNILAKVSPSDILRTAMNSRFLIVSLLVLIFPVWLVPNLKLVYQGQLDESAVISNEALVSYPEKVSFRLELDPQINIVGATLNYDVEQTSCLEVSNQVPVQVSGSTLEWEWPMVRSGNNPPPGVSLWWQWDLTDDQGRTYTTARKEVVFEDNRFDWQTVSDGKVTLNWYAGEEVGPMLLEAAVDGLQLLETDLGIELPQDVTFYIYGSADEMREAVLSIPDWTGGVAFPEYNTILIGVPPRIAADWGRDTVRHELAHLVLGQYGRSCVGGHRPSWLEEGLAMYAEGHPSDEVQRDLETALKENNLIPLRSLNGAFPAHSDEASLAYSQSSSVISFLTEEYGEEKIQSLIQILATGESYDDALQQVYGFNVDGLEQEWRAWYGLPFRPIPPTMTPITAANVPTLVPIAAPVDLPTPQSYATSSAPQSPSEQSSGICALGLLPLALLGAFSWYSRKSAHDIK
jgi:Peptidase MA superfamily